MATTTDQEISNSIAECETVAFDIADLDFSSFFSMAEDQKRKPESRKLWRE